MAWKYCMLCGRDATSDAYTFNIPQHSAAQGSCETGVTPFAKNPIVVCASCNYYFDGTNNGMTTAMRNASQMISGGPFRELPKDRMLWALASACSGGAKGSISAWFPQMINFMSGWGYITEK